MWNPSYSPMQGWGQVGSEGGWVVARARWAPVACTLGLTQCTEVVLLGTDALVNMIPFHVPLSSHGDVFMWQAPTFKASCHALCAWPSPPVGKETKGETLPIERRQLLRGSLSSGAFGHTRGST